MTVWATVRFCLLSWDPTSANVKKPQTSPGVHKEGAMTRHWWKWDLLEERPCNIALRISSCYSNPSPKGLMLLSRINIKQGKRNAQIYWHLWIKMWPGVHAMKPQTPPWHLVIVEIHGSRKLMKSWLKSILQCVQWVYGFTCSHFFSPWLHLREPSYWFPDLWSKSHNNSQGQVEDPEIVSFSLTRSDTTSQGVCLILVPPSKI